MSPDEKASDTYLIKIEPCVSATCMMCIIILAMMLLITSIYSSVSTALALGLSAVALAILLMAVQVRYQTEQK
ncbi:MAG: hypothetical protein RTU09_08180 [Candidatus Thorarchaeota archaeon]